MKRSHATTAAAAIAIAVVSGFTGAALGAAIAEPARPHGSAVGSRWVGSAPRPSSTTYRICDGAYAKGTRC